MTLRNLLGIFALAALLPLAAACNTMEGFGQDVESTGEAIEEEAE